jgi:hypothetical protein
MWKCRVYNYTGKCALSAGHLRIKIRKKGKRKMKDEYANEKGRKGK